MGDGNHPVRYKFADASLESSDILFLAADGTATKIYCRQHPHGYEYGRSLGEALKKLESESFLRISNEHAVNEWHLRGWKSSRGKSFVVLSNDVVLPVPRRRVKAVRERVYQVLAKPTRH
jgi:DNA-binding LytR/AlgR family response regulator